MLYNNIEFTKEIELKREYGNNIKKEKWKKN